MPYNNGNKEKKKVKVKVQKGTKQVNLSGIKTSKRTGKLVPKGTNVKQKTSKSALTEKLKREKARRGVGSPNYKKLSKEIKDLDRSVIIQGRRQSNKARVANKMRNQPNKTEVTSVNTKRKKKGYTTTK